MNILEQSEALKNIPEQALVQEMQMPTGMAPQYLILTEIQRRKRIRDEFQRREAQDIPTVAEETVQAAGMPQAGVMQLAKNMAPQTSMGQNTGVANAAPRQPTMGMAEGGIVNMRAGGKLVNFKGLEFAVFEDGEVYRVLPNGKRLKEPSPAVRRMVIEETTKMLGDRRDQTVVDVEESGLETVEREQSPSAEVEKELSFLNTLREGASVREAAKAAGITLLEAANIVAGSVGLFSREFQKATLQTIQDFVPNKEASRKIQNMIDGITETQKEYFGEGNILDRYVPRITGQSLITSKSDKEKEEEAARAAYEEQQQAETIAALGDEGEYDRLSNLLQGRAGPIPVAPGAISVADTTSNLPFATGEMYEAPIAAPDPTVATPQNLSAQRPTPPASFVLQAPSAVPTSASDAEFSDYMQAERDKSRESFDRKLEKIKIRDVLRGVDSNYLGAADLIDDLREVKDVTDGRDTAGNQLLDYTTLQGSRDPFFSGGDPRFTTLQDAAKYGGVQGVRDIFGGKPKSDAERDLENRSLDYFAGDQFTPPREIYSDLYGGDARATAKYQEEPSSVIDQISDRLYREAQQGELAKQEQLFGDYDAEAQAQRDAEIAGQRDVLEQAALARAGESLKDQQPTKNLTGIAGGIQTAIDSLGDPALNFIEGATTKFGDLVESGQQIVGDYYDAKRAMESDEANLGAGNQIIDPSQTAKAREDQRAAIQKAAQDRVDAEQAKAAKATKAAAAQAGSLEARISDAIAKREKRAEQDKWLSLAYAGAVLAEGRPNSLEKAATAGLGYFQKSRAQQDKFDADMLGLQQRIDAYKARIAAAGSKPSSISAAGLNALQKSASDAAALAIDNPTKANMDYAEYTQALYNQAAALFATQQGIIVPPMGSGRNTQNVAD